MRDRAEQWEKQHKPGQVVQQHPCVETLAKKNNSFHHWTSLLLYPDIILRSQWARYHQWYILIFSTWKRPAVPTWDVGFLLRKPSVLSIVSIVIGGTMWSAIDLISIQCFLNMSTKESDNKNSNDEWWPNVDNRAPCQVVRSEIVANSNHLLRSKLPKMLGKLSYVAPRKWAHLLLSRILLHLNSKSMSTMIRESRRGKARW